MELTMISRTRRLVGSVVLVVGLLIWVFFALAIGDLIVATKPGWVQFAYFVVAGLAWVPPAGLVVRWMYRPVER
jgi:uncharacterized membrane protein